MTEPTTRQQTALQDAFREATIQQMDYTATGQMDKANHADGITVGIVKALAILTDTGEAEAYADLSSHLDD